MSYRAESLAVTLVPCPNVDVSFASFPERFGRVFVSVSVGEDDVFPRGVGSDFDVMVFPTYELE